MPRWTDEQWQAIEKSGTNILVSAGAGSGKTAVLSERVIHKIENGIHVNELLILTFTKAAASEMKDRIRKKIAKNPDMKEELNLLNSSYFTNPLFRHPRRIVLLFRDLCDYQSLCQCY